MMNDLKPYPAMKDSGVSWIGDVPQHWEIKPLKRTFNILNGSTPKSGEPSYWDGNILWATPEDLGKLSSVTLHTTRRMITQEGYESCGTSLAPEGSLLLSTRAPIGHLAIAGVSLCTNQGCHCLVFQGNAESNYYYYQLLIAKEELESWGQGSTFKELSRDKLRVIRLASPPIDEQTAIVSFLDHADRQLRQYIRAKLKLIKLLEERKQVIVNCTVIRGLDPNVRLKPSGAEWLGDVPEHWEIKRCRYLFREVDRRSLDGSEEHLSMSQRLGLVPSHLVENRTLVSESNVGGKLCEVGDLVLNRLKAHLGVFAHARFAGVISPDYTVLRPLEPDSAEYFELVLRSPACRRELRIRAKGIVEGFWRLYTDDLYDIRLPVPPFSERRAIIEHSRSAASEIDRVAHSAKREIGLLREYRLRLIADVVTGKLDVREAVANLPEEEVAHEKEEHAAESDEVDADAELEVAIEEVEG